MKKRKAPKIIKGYATGGSVDPSLLSDSDKSIYDSLTSDQEKQNFLAKLYTDSNGSYDAANAPEQQNVTGAGLQSSASSAFPWLAAATAASKYGQSVLKKDKSGNTLNGPNRTAEEWMKPFHEGAMNSLSEGDYKGAIRDVAGVGTLARGILKGLNLNNETTGVAGYLNDISGNKAENKKRQESAIGYGENNATPIRRLAKGGTVGDKDSGKPKTITPTKEEAKSYLSNSEYIDNARAILNNTLATKYKTTPDKLPEDAVLSVDEANSVLKDTPYNDYYGRVKWMTDYYSKYGYTPYTESGKQVTDLAGTKEVGYDLMDTAYGPKHRSVKYAKLGDTINIDNRTQGKKDGGEVVGPGTGKSDSVPSKVKLKSFVVPAENADVAELLRKVYFGEKTKTANLNQGGGVPVRLSDGEHVFTPEEKQHLIANGINVDALAPNQDKNSDGKVDGGEVDGGDGYKFDMSAIGKDDKRLTKEEYNKLTKEEKSVINELAAAYNEAYSSNGKVKSGTYKGRSADQMKSLVNNAHAKYQVEVKYRDEQKKSAEGVQSMSDRINQWKEGQKEKSYTDESSAVQNTKKENKKENKKAATISNKNIASEGNVTGNDMSWEDFISRDTNVGPINELAADVPADDPRKESIKKAGQPGGLEKLSDDEKADVKSYLGEKGITSPDKTTKKEGGNGGGGDGDGMKLRIEDILGLTQAGIGAEQLLQDGKRPVDKLSADYLSAVDQAKADATYGFDNATKQLYESNVEGARLDVLDLANQTAGGNPLSAMNAARSATNQYAKNMLELASADARLKMDKVQYRNALLEGKVEKERRLFADKLNAFNVNQQAGADLLGAGIENIIGSQRVRREQDYLNTLQNNQTNSNRQMGQSLINANT